MSTSLEEFPVGSVVIDSSEPAPWNEHMVVGYHGRSECLVTPLHPAPWMTEAEARRIQRRPSSRLKRPRAEPPADPTEAPPVPPPD